MNRRSGNPVSYSSPLTGTTTTSASVRQYHHVHRRPGQVATGVTTVPAATKVDFHELANFALHEKEYQEGVIHSKNGSTSNTFDDPSLHKSNVNQQQQPFDSPSTDRRHGPVTKLGFHDLANFALHGQERERKDEHLIHSSNRNGSSFDDHHNDSHHHQHQKSNSNHHMNDYPSLIKQQPIGSEGDLIDFSSSVVDVGAFGGSNSSSSSSSSNVLIRSNSSGSASNGAVGGSIKSGPNKIPPGLVKGHSVDSAVASFNQDFPSLVPSGSTSSSSVNNSVWDPTKTRLIGNGMSKLTIITKQVKPVAESAVVKATTAPVLTEAIKTTAGLSLVTKKRGSLPASTSSVVGPLTVPKESCITGNGSTGIQTRGMNPSPSVPVPSSASVSIGSKSMVTPSLEILVTKPNKSRENRNEFLKSLRSDSSNKAASSTGTSDGSNKNVNSMDSKNDGSSRSRNGSSMVSIQSSVKGKSDPMKGSTTSCDVGKPGNEEDPLVSVYLDKMTASPEERKGISVLIEQQHGIKVNQMNFQEGKNSQGEKLQEKFQEGKNSQGEKLQEKFQEGNHQEGVLPTVVMGSLDQVLVSNKENVLSRLSSNVEGRMNESLRMNQSGGGQVLEEATSCDSILSSSLEAEQRLLREMGWREEDADDSLFAPLTEDEVKEFRARFKTNHHVLGHSGQCQVGSSLLGSGSLIGGGSNQFSSAGNGQLLDLNIIGTSNGPPGFESSNRSNFAPPGFGLKQGSSSAFNPHFFANRPASLTTDPPAEEEDSSSDDSSSDEE